MFFCVYNLLSLQDNGDCVERNKQVGKRHCKAECIEDILFDFKGTAAQSKERHWQHRQQVFALDAVDGCVVNRCPADAQVYHKGKDNKGDKAEHTSVADSQCVAVPFTAEGGKHRTDENDDDKAVADKHAVVAQHATRHTLDVVCAVFKDCGKNEFKGYHRVLQHKADVEGCLRICGQKCLQTFR